MNQCKHNQVQQLVRMYDCAQSAITFNNINLPTYDIHSREARDQMLFSLDALATSFNRISGMHLQKSKEQNERINSLKERILKCKAKVQSLEGLNQAIIFVSPSEYPRLYEFDPQKNVSRFKEYLQRTRINKLDMKSQYMVKHQLEKLGEKSKVTISQLDRFVMFMMSQLRNRRKTLFDKGAPKQTIESLGRIPANVKYVDSLIVFNSNILPYKRYEVRDNYVVRTAQAEAKPEIPVAPSEQLQGYNRIGYQANTNSYKPAQKPFEMPEIDDLELPGVVNLSLAPINTTANLKQGLIKKEVASDPSIKNDANASKLSHVTSSTEGSSQFNQNAVTAPFNTTSLLPPPPPPPTSNNSPIFYLPPPPPPPPAQFHSTNASSGLPLPPPPPPPSNNSPTFLLPPPPPPPPPSQFSISKPTIGLPPPMPSMAPVSSTLAPPQALATALPPQVFADSRSAMLREIQNFKNNRNLRKVQTKETGGVKKPGEQTQKAPPARPPGQPMSHNEALFAKILLRGKTLRPDRDDQ